MNLIIAEGNKYLFSVLAYETYPPVIFLCLNTDAAKTTKLWVEKWQDDHVLCVLNSGWDNYPDMAFAWWKPAQPQTISVSRADFRAGDLRTRIRELWRQVPQLCYEACGFHALGLGITNLERRRNSIPWMHSRTHGGQMTNANRFAPRTLYMRIGRHQCWHFKQFGSANKHCT